MWKWNKKNLISVYRCLYYIKPEEVVIAKGNNKTKDPTLLLNHWINIRFFSQSSSMVLGTKNPPTPALWSWEIIGLTMYLFVLDPCGKSWWSWSWMSTSCDLEGAGVYGYVGYPTTSSQRRKTCSGFLEELEKAIEAAHVDRKGVSSS